MARLPISGLTALTTPASGDHVPIVDVSDTTASAQGTTKRITYANLATALGLEAGSFDPSVPRVLRFAGVTVATHVNHGLFWARPAADMGDGFMWDAWVRSRDGGYVISDGYGGAHALLWGFGGVAAGVTGNVWNGTAITSFGGSYQPSDDEWQHIAVHWNGSSIYTYVNGIADGRTAFAGPRMSAGTGADGVLYVGGSDHSVWSGDIAFLRGWDRIDPRPDHPAFPFIPERHPMRWANAAGDDVPCEFYCDYTSCAGGMTLLDTSPAGVDSGLGYRQFHHGVIYNPTPLGAEEFAFTPVQRSGPVLPEWVADPTCPLGRAAGDTTAPGGATYTPPATPSGCLAFDSFSRANQTLAFQAAPTLGSTEAGSLGPLAWQVGILGGYETSGAFGILGGMAAPTNIGYMAAWVPLGTAAQDVRVKRLKSSAFLGATGIALRVADAANYHAVWYEPTNSSAGTIVVTKVTGTVGSPTLTNVATLSSVTDDFTHLRAKFVGTTITVYKGDGTTWTQVGSPITGQSTGSTNQDAGITNNSGSANWTSLIRWDDFAAFLGS